LTKPVSRTISTSAVSARRKYVVECLFDRDATANDGPKLSSALTSPLPNDGPNLSADATANDGCNDGHKTVFCTHPTLTHPSTSSNAFPAVLVDAFR